jgi:ribonuclease P protein component
VNQTFARSYRLTKTDEFSSVFGFRRALRGPLIMLHYQPQEPASNTSRLGLVVGKKMLKRAVDRNLFKRIIHDQFRQTRAALPAVDIIVRLANKPGTLDRKQLAGEFHMLLRKLPRSLPAVKAE